TRDSFSPIQSVDAPTAPAFSQSPPADRSAPEQRKRRSRSTMQRKGRRVSIRFSFEIDSFATLTARFSLPTAHFTLRLKPSETKLEDQCFRSEAISANWARARLGNLRRFIHPGFSIALGPKLVRQSGYTV